MGVEKGAPSYLERIKLPALSIQELSVPASQVDRIEWECQMHKQQAEYNAKEAARELLLKNNICPVHLKRLYNPATGNPHKDSRVYCPECNEADMAAAYKRLGVTP